MRLFIAEKPSLGRAIANGLGNQKKGDGCITCGNDIVTWCFGHMLAQAWPQDYDPAYAHWKRDHLPIIPHKWQNTVKKEAAGQLKIIGKLLKDADCIVNAGDPDREGQLLVDEVLEHFGYKGKVQRIWLASLDDTSVKKAIAGISDNSKFHNLRDSAIARARADWLFGINATRAMTIKGRDSGRPDVLSIGRVQTPTLALVVARDKEIASFKPVDYFNIKGIFTLDARQFSANFIFPENQEGLDGAGRLVDGAIAKNLAGKFQGKDGTICSFTAEEKTKQPPLPHCLSSLQKAASAKLGMSAQQVLDTAQKLYEKKLTTYPRTDCRYLPVEQYQEAENVLKALSSFAGLEKIAGNAHAELKSSAWNTKKVTAHHAIAPTGEKPDGLSGRELDLFQMIATSFCLQFYPPMRYEAQKIALEIGGNRFEATGRAILEAGWTSVNQDEDEDEAALQTLPSLEKGQTVHCSEIQLQKKKTTPPSRFTEGTLIEAMANVHRFVSDADAKAQLKEAKGIGTEATRARVLETLKERKYLAVEKKAIVSTPLGREVIGLTPNELKDPITTAEWEARLEAIADGREQLDVFLKEQCAVLPELLRNILGDSTPAFPCPNCGAPLLRRQSMKDKSWFWGCSGYPSCKTTLPDDNGNPGKRGSELTEFKCPDCNKPLRKLNGAKGEFFGCSGYPECKKSFPMGADGKPDFRLRNSSGRKK
ncbi:MAG: DNA topoisomerase 3 [Desulfovibrio sp.]|jgi:DNA topoisomerase-3